MIEKYENIKNDIFNTFDLSSIPDTIAIIRK